MSQARAPHSSLFSPDVPNARVLMALELLLAAGEAARSAGGDVWDFALEFTELRGSGITPTDLRWLVRMGYAKHAQERVDPTSSRRTFTPISNLAFPRHTCFVATDQGERLAVLGSNRLALGDSVTAAPPPGASLPRWDGILRQLRWRGRVVKEFRVPARNQEMILAALEEEGWPPHIDDPLPPVDGLDSKARLHDAIKNLNRNQLTRLLCFCGDGTGCGVKWHLLPV